MELWIRSQDKTKLEQVFSLCTFEISDGKEMKYVIENSDSYLGEYKSKERALEVLDEINGILQLKLCSTLGTFEEVFNGYTEEQLRLVLKQIAVYEMPSE